MKRRGLNLGQRLQTGGGQLGRVDFQSKRRRGRASRGWATPSSVIREEPMERLAPCGWRAPRSASPASVKGTIGSMQSATNRAVSSHETKGFVRRFLEPSRPVGFVTDGFRRNPARLLQTSNVWAKGLAGGSVPVFPFDFRPPVSDFRRSGYRPHQPKRRAAMSWPMKRVRSE